MSNRIKGLFPGRNGGGYKQEYDDRRTQMQIKSMREAADKLHKRMMQEIDILVPVGRKKFCAWIFPTWLNNGLIIILSCLPPNILIRWAVAPTGVHMAYKWVMLLPLVIINSVLRLFIIGPLQYLKMRIYLYGISREVRQIDEYNCELIIAKKGGATQHFTQDWRYGEVKRMVSEFTS